MDLIRKINRNHGLGDRDIQRSGNDPVVVLRGKLERACERLSRDLYNTKTHFLLEFIQNADDNEYDPHVVPSLHLHLRGRELTIRCNEKGFRVDNVEAICDIGSSTKRRETRSEGYIGEKGIGFKAVFVVAERVHVASREFTFRFDRDGPLGMINPIWDASYPSDPGWTTFRLNILHTIDINDLREQIRIIHPSLLLFLRRLRAIDIDVATTNQPTDGNTKITISRIDELGNVVRLECHENGCVTSSAKYIVFKQTTRTYTGEEKRRGIGESEVVLAFPVTADGEPEMGNQFVHAFLPVAKYGLNFVVQADFLTPASREGIVIDSKWNLSLFDGVTETFLHAVEQFQQDPVLRYSWMRFIPIHAQSAFSAVAEGMIARLQTREVLLSVDGRYRRPEDVVTIPKGLRINRTEPLIPPQYLLSLGVKALSDQHFLDGLTAMDRANVIGAQTEQWHNIVCAHLSDMPRIKGKFSQQILDLRLLPLNDGSWRPAREAEQYVFMSEMDMLQDMEFKCIANDVKEHSARYAFFQLLGVRRADTNLIATKILLQVRLSSSVPTLIRYARDGQTGHVAMSDELYLDVPLEGMPGHEVKLRNVLPSDVRFLHQDYVELYPEDRYWLSWLQDCLGLHTSPRIVLGRLSPEIYSMARNLETSKFLAALRAFWPQLSASISPAGIIDMSNIEVVCEDGVAYPLATTSLKRQNLAWLPATLSSCLHFLPLPDPDDLSWSFLTRVGVTMEANAAAWIGMLFRLQEMNSADEKTVVSVYQQLDARFNEAADFIRGSFYQYPLILVPSDGQNRSVASWTSCCDAYWDGPSTLRSKFIVKSRYAALEDLFSRKLLLQNAPLEVLVDELSTFAAEHEGRPIAGDTVQILEQMLVDISQYIAWKPAAQFALLGLADRAIFPVHIRGEIRLQRIDEFFVSEKGSKSVERFRNSVPILAFSSAQTLSQLRPMLESNIWPSPLRVLETSLTAKSIPLGPKTLDQENTDLYSGRSEYVQHITQYCPSAGQMEFLAKMRSTSIYVVDTVIVMWSLAGNTVNVQSDVKVAIVETEDSVIFYVSKACAAMPRTRDREICSLLGDRVAIDKLALLQFVSMPWDDLLLYLEDEGVDISTCIPQTTQESTYEQEQVKVEPTVSYPVPPEPQQSPEPTVSQRSQPSEPQYSPNPAAPPFVPSNSTNAPAERQRRSADVRDKNTEKPSAFHASPSRVPAREPEVQNQAWRTQPASYPTPALAPAQNNAHRRRASTLDQHILQQLETASSTTSVPFAPAVPPQRREQSAGKGESTGGTPYQESERDRANGVLGEVYVFHMLQRILGPGFTENNWTSELRGQVPGFSPFNGPSIADFQYKDKDGVLTDLWHGKKQRKSWKGRWPTYHFEVKTTSGAASEPFHMSYAQLQAARQCSIAARASHGVPQDVYVIIRVSEIKSAQPKHDIYLDPHKWFYEGGLVIRSDIEASPP
ncbi:uncharacterized protein B0H18DRAFT_1118012 [Fomitopsis serialis]|uniref:uncharacterized protein n=1 Tax=Fomitopsis serialis TaxID=139415 RepID=UPI0020078163|nr:uncharacterized protein B0H18DRAFT_1118012 [Neoantrodia serialis]KAH9928331.1 hypothetical protein B0H18DRAFT_1118012 [Neoantrodia serialis]